MWEYQLQSTGLANFQTKRFLEDERVIWPGDNLLERFVDLIAPIVRLTTRNENITLAAQRDALLPRLVAGAIGVR